MQPIDISKMPDLLNLVEEVEATKEPRELKRDNKIVAVLSPFVGWEVYKPNPEDLQSSLAAIGSWSDLDADELIAKIHEWRHEGTRPATRP